MKRIRVASLQYFIRPVQTFEQFHDQVEGLIDTAADYDDFFLPVIDHEAALAEDVQTGIIFV
ncbi:MAG: hypothetical protein ACRD2R_03800 [Terriglobales bacterium]